MGIKPKLAELIKHVMYVIAFLTGLYAQDEREVFECIYPDGRDITLSCSDLQNTVIESTMTRTAFLKYNSTQDSTCLRYNSCCNPFQQSSEVNIPDNFPEYYSLLVQQCDGKEECHVHTNPVPVRQHCDYLCYNTCSCFSRYVSIEYRCVEKQETTPPSSPFPTTAQTTVTVPTTTLEDLTSSTEILTVESTQSTTLAGATTMTPEPLAFVVQVYMGLTTACIMVIIILLVVILVQSRFKPKPARLEYSKVISEQESNNNKENLRASITVLRVNDYDAENHTASEGHGITACVNPVFESADSEPSNVTSTDYIDYEFWKAPDMKLRLGTDTSTEEYQKTVPKPKPPVNKKPVAKRPNKFPTYENLKIGQGSVIILSEETEDTKDNEFDDTEFVHNSLYVSA